MLEQNLFLRYFTFVDFGPCGRRSSIQYDTYVEV